MSVVKGTGLGGTKSTCVGCGGTCSGGCSGGCSGSACKGSCSAFCASGCSGGCGGGCNVSCTGCKGGCGGTCSGSCKTACSGCGGCDGGCSSCTGGCSGGCGGQCKEYCLGTCKTTCGKQCTNQSYSNVSNLEINKNEFLKADKINLIAEAIAYEAKRRGKNPTNTVFIVGSNIDDQQISIVINNFKLANQPIDVQKEGQRSLYSLLEEFVSKLKIAWNKTVDNHTKKES